MSIIKVIGELKKIEGIGQGPKCKLGVNVQVEKRVIKWKSNMWLSRSLELKLALGAFGIQIR